MTTKTKSTRAVTLSTKTPVSQDNLTTPKKTVAKKSPRATNTIQTLPANPFCFEILTLANNQRTNAKKVEILKKYEHPSIKSVLIWNFDDSVVSALPYGDVPYGGLDKHSNQTGTLSGQIQDKVAKMEEISSGSLGVASETLQDRTSLRREYKKLYNFVKGGNDALPSTRKEMMFIQLLEGLHPLEAEILILTKDKKLQTKYKLTQEIVSQAYPDIQWGNRS